MFYSSEEIETFAVAAAGIPADTTDYFGDTFLMALDASTSNYLVYEEVRGPIQPLDVLLELVEPVHSADKLAKLIQEAIQRSNVGTLKRNLKSFTDLELLTTTPIPCPRKGRFLQMSSCQIDHDAWMGVSKVNYLHYFCVL